MLITYSIYTSKKKNIRLKFKGLVLLKQNVTQLSHDVTGHIKGCGTES